ncbi:hypothetical protein [Bacillus mycoides]|uniref:Peptidase C39-like domain-containing protein n=1 Tax=Bacillus mycoides TaxID=1405 RepID=A0ABC9QV56_BACMY|nr:hypothetical protein [Bacillus mycoides]EJR30052.1 hypothetical protein III_05821 [Bacillus mycoides]
MKISIKQTGPTCGIYAMLNGLYNLNKIEAVSKKQTDEVVCNLLSKNVIKKREKAINSKTYLGEFFDLNSYKNFIDNNWEIFNQVTGCEDVKYDVSIKNTEHLNSKELIAKLQHNKCFVLFSICTYKRLTKNHIISHWVSIIGYDNNTCKYIVVDSLKGKIKKYSLERLYRENNRLQDAQFQWKKFKIGKLCYWDHPWGLHPVKKHIKEQYGNKRVYLKDGVIKHKIPHTSGEMIIIEKL